MKLNRVLDHLCLCKAPMKTKPPKCSLNDFLSVWLCVYVPGEEEGRRQGKHVRTVIFRIWWGGTLSAFYVLTSAGNTFPLQCLLWSFRKSLPQNSVGFSDICGCLMAVKTRAIVDKEVILVAVRSNRYAMKLKVGGKQRRLILWVYHVSSSSISLHVGLCLLCTAETSEIPLNCLEKQMFPHQALSNEFASSYQMPAHLRDTAATMDVSPNHK